MTENTPTENHPHANPKLQKATKGFERTELRDSDKKLRGWYNAIHNQTSIEVASVHTFEEMKESFLEGSPVEFTLITGYVLNILGEDYNYGRGEHKYLTEDKRGERAVMVEVKETSQKKELFVSGLDVGRKTTWIKEKGKNNVRRETPNPDNWTVTCYENWYHEYNYNAGSESGRTLYRITCNNGVITWKLLNSVRDR